MKNIFFAFLIIVVWASCNNSSNKGEENSNISKLDTQDGISGFDLFLSKVVSEGYTIDSIEEKRAFNSFDSVIELNYIRKQVFNKSEQELNLPTKIYRTILRNKEYDIKKAVIIEIIFESEKDARMWIMTFENSKYKEMIENKPKTRLLIGGKSIFFIQTYRDMQGKEIEKLKELMEETVDLNAVENKG